MARITPARAIIAACLGLALLSVLALAWTPSSDPFAWISWGQEITDPRAALQIAGGPSWKPFPVFFTTIFGLFGHAGPGLWLFLVRAIGLLSLYAAYRLGSRFAGPVAGVIALVGLLLLQDYLRYMARGTSEPIVIAAVLWAIELHLAGHRRLAFALGVLGALNRPELTAFVLADAAYLWRREPSSRPLLIAGLLLIPLGWLVPPWINVNDPLQANHAALGGQGGQHSPFGELGTSAPLMTPALLALAGLGAAMAVVRRDRALLGLVALAVIWALIAAAETVVSFGTLRYLLPAAAIGCVVAGVGVVWAAELVAARRGGRPVEIACVAALIALTLPWTIPRAGRLGDQVREANLAGRLQHQLFQAVDRAGGRAVVVPCRHSAVAVNHTLASALAWKLEIPLTRSKGVLRGTGYAFVHPKVEPAGSPPVIRDRAIRQLRLVTRVGRWRVFEVTRRGASATPHCGRAGRA